MTAQNTALETSTVETPVEANTDTATPAKRRGGRPRKVAAEGAGRRTNKRNLTAKSDNQTATKSAAELLAEQEATLIKKYSRIVKGSIQRHNSGRYAGKITVTIACKTKDCPNTRTVATSDLFQVKYCEECTEANRQARRKKNKKAEKATAAKA